MKLYRATALIDDTMERYRVWHFIYAKDQERAKQLFMKKYDDGWNTIKDFTIMEANFEMLLGDD